MVVQGQLAASCGKIGQQPPVFPCCQRCRCTLLARSMNTADRVSSTRCCDYCPAASGHSHMHACMHACGVRAALREHFHPCCSLAAGQRVVVIVT